MNKEYYLRQLQQSQPVTLPQVLNQKEERVACQRRLLSQKGCLICFTMNIAGAIKTCPLFSKAFGEGEQRITEQLEWHHIPVILREKRFTPAGEELYLLVGGPAHKVKQLMVQVEDSFPMGRLYDIDVLTAANCKSSREELGQPPRRCLICGEKAALCARSQRHTVQQLQEKTVELICNYFNSRYADAVAELCSRALLCEVSVTPKPGLVDRANNGAHKDMDFITFTNSACALTPYFRDFVLQGIEGSRLPPQQLFASLRYPGRRAEQAMNRATEGINAHKGLIFSMGVLCAAAGRLFDREEPVTAQAVFSLSKEMCASLLEDFADLPSQEAQCTTGENLYRQYGVLGARGEAAQGFPSVKNIGLPAFKRYLAQGKTINDAGVYTLLHFIAAVEDTNIIHRSSRERLHSLQQQVRSMLTKEPLSLKEIEALDRQLVQENISPGGCADLLALTYFVWLLEEELISRQEDFCITRRTV